MTEAGPGNGDLVIVPFVDPPGTGLAVVMGDVGMLHAPDMVKGMLACQMLIDNHDQAYELSDEMMLFLPPSMLRVAIKRFDMFLPLLKKE